VRFNPPPDWPQPPAGWVPPPGWKPDPAWPDPPDGWQLWLRDEDTTPVPMPEIPSVAVPPAEPPMPPATTPMSPDVVIMPEPPAAGAPAAEAPDVSALVRRISDLEAALAAACSGASEIVELNDQRVLQDVGIYRYHHPLEDAAAYRERLSALNAQIDELVRGGRAVLAADMFTFDGSLAKGRKMVSDLSKLMLRAYNAEADNCVRSLRSGNISTARKRLENAMKSIEKLGVIMEMRVDPDYHQTRVEELELTADFQMKLQEEKEQAREERELLREQRRAEKELAAERERLDKERAHYASALEALRAKGDETAAGELEGRLAEIDAAIEAGRRRLDR